MKWPGNRNPVYYTTLEDTNTALDPHKFEPMPEATPAGKATDSGLKPFTFAQAKGGLTLAFGVKPPNIDITI